MESQGKLQLKKHKEESVARLSQNKTMKDMSRLLINNTLNIKGAILDVTDMMRVAQHYRRACVQEYVFENAKDDITEEQALMIAERAIELEDNYGMCEDDAVNEARAKLGFKKAFFG
jgi:hypothetical protein